MDPDAAINFHLFIVSVSPIHILLCIVFYKCQSVPPGSHLFAGEWRVGGSGSGDGADPILSFDAHAPILLGKLLQSEQAKSRWHLSEAAKTHIVLSNGGAWVTCWSETNSSLGKGNTQLTMGKS